MDVGAKVYVDLSMFADPAVQSAISWSELLEPLFVNNYESDPALSWQYFGSSEGFVRLYPGTSSELDEAYKF